MKILHIIGYFQPELGYEEYYTAMNQVKMGHDVHVITSDMIFPFKNVEKMLKQSGSKYKTRKRKVGFSKVDGIKVYRLPHYLEYMDCIFVRGMKKHICKIDPDIIHVHEPKQGTGFQGVYHAKDRYPIVIDSHDCGLINTDVYILDKSLRSLKALVIRYEYYGFRKRLANYSFKRTKHIIAPVKCVVDFLDWVYGIKGKKVRYVPLGADSSVFYPDNRKRKKIRKKLDIGDDEVVITTSGIMSERKRIDVLIKTFHKLQKDHKIRLLIIGEGSEEYVGSLKDLVKRLKLKGKVTFAGFLSKEVLNEYLNASDIGAWVANNSVSMIEAMACGLPVIIPEMQFHEPATYGNGFIFPKNDFRRFEDYLKKLVENPELRKKMGKNSLDAVERDLSYVAYTKKILDIYEERLKRK